MCVDSYPRAFSHEHLRCVFPQRMMGSLNDSIIVSATALLTFWDGVYLLGEVPCVVGCPAAPLAPLPSVDDEVTHPPTLSLWHPVVS